MTFHSVGATLERRWSVSPHLECEDAEARGAAQRDAGREDQAG
jgi:hypothetical protein